MLYFVDLSQKYKQERKTFVIPRGYVHIFKINNVYYYKVKLGKNLTKICAKTFFNKFNILKNI